MSDMQNTKLVQFQIPEATHSELKNVAQGLGFSMTTVVKLAIQDFLAARRVSRDKIPGIRDSTLFKKYKKDPALMLWIRDTWATATPEWKSKMASTEVYDELLVWLKEQPAP